MATIKRFEDLDVWKRARQLTNLIYDVSDCGAFTRDYGLRDQMRRAAVSILSNIAEGFESQTQATFVDFLGHAKRSAGELRAQLYIALDRGYMNENQFDQAIEQVVICSKQITNFIQYLATPTEHSQSQGYRGVL